MVLLSPNHLFRRAFARRVYACVAKCQIAKHDLLPCAQRQRAANERDGKRWSHQRGANVRMSVVIVPTRVMPIIAIRRRDFVQHLFQIGDDTGLVLNRRQAASRAGTKNRDDTRREFRFFHRVREGIGNVFVRRTRRACGCAVRE